MKLSIIFSTRNLLSIACAGLLWFSSSLALALPVNINNADAEMIADALNGIGQKTAEKIIDYRKANGPFKSADDLLNIQGIGEKKLAKIREDVKLK